MSNDGSVMNTLLLAINRTVFKKGDQSSTPKTPSVGGTIWKAADYLLEKELLKFALEHRQVK